MALWKLKLTMAGTLALIIGLTTLIIAWIMSIIGYFDIYLIAGFIITINILQWLLAPYIIDSIYRVREVKPSELPWLHQYVREIASRSGIEPPKVMIADIPIPNAFAYGSPIAGRRVAITRGLIESVPKDEIKAIVGHEIGHLKHRDMEVMMIASLMPALIFLLGRWLMIAGLFSGGRRDREGGGGAIMFIVGAALMAFSFVLNLMVLGLSRLREYYADSHSAMVVEDGATKLQRALTRLVLETRRLIGRGLDVSNFSQFRALFITDPMRAVEDAESSAFLTGTDRIIREVERLKRREVTLTERILELFSTHPNVTKRIRALEELKRTISCS